MNPLLKKLSIIFGIISIISFSLMVFLWNRYVSEQEILTQEQVKLKQPCEPLNMRVVKAQDRVSLLWDTNSKCVGFVLLGDTYAAFSNLPYKVLSADGEQPTENHEVSIMNHDIESNKYAIIVSDGEWYGINDSPFTLAEN